MEFQEYQIILHTGNEDGAGTNANVVIELFGSLDNEEFKLPDNSGNDTEKGSIDYYTVRAGKNLGEIKLLKVSLEKTDDDDPIWYLFKVEISTNIAGKQYQWEFPAKIWIAPKDVTPIHGALEIAYITPFGASDKPPSDGAIIVISRGEDDKDKDT